MFRARIAVFITRHVLLRQTSTIKNVHFCTITFSIKEFIFRNKTKYFEYFENSRILEIPYDFPSIGNAKGNPRFFQSR